MATRPRGVALGVGYGHQALQHRQHEAGRLAGAGLRAGQQVAALQHGRDGLHLDRGGDVVAVFAHGTQERLGQAEVGEFHSMDRPA